MYVPGIYIYSEKAIDTCKKLNKKFIHENVFHMRAKKKWLIACCWMTSLLQKSYKSYKTVLRVDIVNLACVQVR